MRAETARALIVYLGLILVAVIQAVWYYPKLPDPVASHFNGAGVADGWMSRNAFVSFDLGFVLFMAAVFFGGGLLTRRVPDPMVNMPNKAYWLAPEPRDETHATLSRFILWLGGSVVVFMIAINQGAIRANLSPEPKLGNAFWVLLITYLSFTAILIVGIFLRFRMPKGSAQPDA